MAKKATAAASPEDDDKKPVRGEIYKVRRPTEFSQVLGQDGPVRILSALVERKEVPRFLLFTGPSGVGKTTLARILRDKLGCADDPLDFHEINFATDGGVDTVRIIEDGLTRGPIAGGRCVVYMLDEFHAASKNAFEALLKVLEDGPKHIYFMACTTNASKIPATIKTRATLVALGPVNHMLLSKLVQQEAAAAGIELEGKSLDRIVNAAEGSPRKALVMLNVLKAAPNGTEDEQMALLPEVLCDSEFKDFAIALGKAGTKMQTIGSLLKRLPEGTDAEGIRRSILSWYTGVFFRDYSDRALAILAAFDKPTYDSGMARIINACAEVCGK